MATIRDQLCAQGDTLRAKDGSVCEMRVPATREMVTAGAEEVRSAAG